MRIVRESWFKLAEPEACRFLKSKLKNNKKLQGEVKEYIKRKLDAEPSELYCYHMHCNRSVITMSWEVKKIYEYFKQMKADYLKKLRKQGLLVNIKGRGANERPCLCEENVLAHENENRVCEEENRDGEENDGEENDGHSYCLAVMGPCHESGE